MQELTHALFKDSKVIGAESRGGAQGRARGLKVKGEKRFFFGDFWHL